MKAKLIPYGKRKEPDRFGSESFYPANVTLKLNGICRLRELGYRGGELRFALWWLGLHEFDAQIRKYIRECLDAPNKLMKESLRRRANETGVTEQDIYATDLEKYLPIMTSIGTVFHKALDPDSSMGSSDINKAILAWASSLQRIPPDQVKLFDQERKELKENLMEDFTQSQIARENKGVISVILEKLVNGVISGFIKLKVLTAKPELFELSRRIIKKDTEIRSYIVFTRDTYASLNSGQSERKKSRMGTVRYLTLWSRAFVLLVMVSFFSAAQPNILRNSTPSYNK